MFILQFNSTSSNCYSEIVERWQVYSSPDAPSFTVFMDDYTSGECTLLFTLLCLALGIPTNQRTARSTSICLRIYSVTMHE
ncbi:hypothetical protein VNO78_08057 [Psophocarpus tetragonolobus]|uniref:Uncharacterized protein n=1 Tax=Psophocarpus tetragonolobus TaxID=3891 RepID=A0AAN9XSM0_PSOTE